MWHIVSRFATHYANNIWSRHRHYVLCCMCGHQTVMHSNYLVRHIPCPSFSVPAFSDDPFKRGLLDTFTDSAFVKKIQVIKHSRFSINVCLYTSETTHDRHALLTAGIISRLSLLMVSNQ